MYILLRHAEKRSGANPDLTAKGRRRASDLARMFGENTSISIYSTAYNRTKQTAGPLSEASGQPIIEYDRDDIVALVEALVSVDGLKCVIGHSRSTLELLEELTGFTVDPFDEDTEFDRLYLFEVPLNFKADLVQMRYGEA